MIFSQLLDRWRPVIAVTARHDEIVFTGNDVYATAPIVWFNYEGQFVAIGEERAHATEFAVRGYRRVELLGPGAVLADTGEVGEASEKFLRYALLVAMGNHPLRSWLRPQVTYCEEGQLLTRGRSFQTARLAAFSALARRGNVHSLHATPST